MVNLDYSRFESEFENCTLPALLKQRAQELGDMPYVKFRDKTVTYTEMNETTNRVANSLTDLGIQHGDKVCLLMKNSLEFIYAWYGLAKLGAVMVPVNPNLKGNLLRHIVTNSEATVLFIDNDLIERIKLIEDEVGNVTKMIRVDENPEVQSTDHFTAIDILEFDTLLAGSPDQPEDKVKPADAMSILYTSGTTGPSKGAMLSQHYYYDNALMAIHFQNHTEGDVLFSCLPMFHANAQLTSCYTALLTKGTFVMSKLFSLSTFMDEIAECKATHTNVMGSILILLMKQAPSPEDKNNTLKVINSVPLIPDALEFEKRFGVKLVGMFGATETAICIASPFDEETKSDSCGKALPHFDCRIVDDNDIECPRGTKGEIIVRGKVPFVQMAGYYNMPEATLAAFQNLWYHTGDFGIQDEQGYFYFVDRKKDAIRRRGENISSYEVEEVVNSHPNVLESAAVAVKDEVMTEDEVKIFVILKNGESLSAEDLILFCKDRMAYFMIPRYVEFVDQFPKTPNQKVQKFALRDRGNSAATWDREASGIKIER
ncbi:MAG: ATP-dependent acyl-CoA ligase [Rhodospirillaceae bacterium]|jgi:crotonobetaine/carnitine-CoA ligase|nr:ATP-dependent acyl-CoA ligase [Rhodospirillaceae bacterium]MAF49874.1 ATP-dependent acyl-CoA ligase [Rhodospirillaceae bacterium]MDP6642991.1 AMP-binding protein [Rhodospirillales bacterium]|tara:strand:+ start:1679 stop:3307 length:1629 start_codon:yes stop_codon:yes gene_type:complete